MNTSSPSIVRSWGRRWPVVNFEDRVALEYLRSRSDVIAESIGCIGLSGGGCRSALLHATSDGIAGAVVVGMMSTYHELLGDHIEPHTWMFFPPGLAAFADWPDLAASRASAPLLIQYLRDDPLFLAKGMELAHRRVASHYRESAGAPSTRYPAGLTLAATWNSQRAFARGKQMGRDARARGYHVDLGPGIDPYRTPLGGRNFEYNTGEDPFLGSELVVPLVAGFQKQGVWANVKHYAANEQEYRRENINILVDERSLREIYLPPFEAAVKEGHAASVMGALNAVNGDFACESHYLDTQVLKRDWNFDGVLLSDYQGIHDGVKPANAGMDLDMPFSTFMNQQTLRAGAEVAQLYVGEENPRVPRPIKELRGFAKDYLRPGETKQVTIKLNQRSLAFYNVQARGWEADPGAYAISVGASSQDIRLKGRLINPSLSMISVSDSEPVAEFEPGD
jgi:hypothetical protein